MRQAETVWKSNAESGSMTLVERWNYHGELSAQFPISPLRIVYAKAGMQPAACLLRDRRGVVDHKLYWMTPEGETEGHYLAAVLNSETTRACAEKYQSRGQFGARDFDKVSFNLPIPRFDPKNEIHRALADAAAEAERVAATVALSENVKFQRARGMIRDSLTEAGIARKIDDLVARLLDGK